VDVGALQHQTAAPTENIRVAAEDLGPSEPTPAFGNHVDELEEMAENVFKNQGEREDEQFDLEEMNRIAKILK
jgi:hypothetical protein